MSLAWSHVLGWSQCWRAFALGPVIGACVPSSVCGPSSATVQRVIDGDTIELSGGVHIRLLQVDAPELGSGSGDCFGPEAAAHTRQAVEGREIDLHYDEAACVDRFGRTLAYVRAGEMELNSELVRQGLACALYVAPAGSQRREEFDTLESAAKTNRIGMWGACAKVPCDSK